jgi:predicted nuclease of restriction endonuclease-like (RecB) superfamily
MNKTELPDNYPQWLASLKQQIVCAQQRAALAVNQELIQLYWQMGSDILQRQAEQGWGSKVIERLAKDLSQAFPDLKGFSARNVKY